MTSTSAPILYTVPPNHCILLTNEKVTGPAAAALLRRSGISNSPNTDGLEVLDNATGGGILITELFHRLEQHPGSSPTVTRVVAGDINASMLQAVRLKKHDASQTSSSSLWAKVQISHLDQQALAPLADASFTHVFSNFGIFFCPDDDKALRETHRVLRPNGVAGFTSWKSIGWWEGVAQPALQEFVPDPPPLPTPGGLFPSRGWSEPEAILAKMEGA